MLYLVTGGSASGKSEYAEKLAMKLHEERFPQGKLYYVATMAVYDEECRRRVEKHRAMRSGKGFDTVECQTCLEQVEAAEGDVLLVECLSNLLANEMYQEQGRIRARLSAAGDPAEEALRQAEEAVVRPLLALADRAGGLVAVTNEVFSDGARYDEEMETYLMLLGRINARLAEAAQGVTEVVCSIPVAQKGELVC